PLRPALPRRPDRPGARSGQQGAGQRYAGQRHSGRVRALEGQRYG
ncbi:hypothetical protein, partial [Mycobacterium marinum]